MTAIIKAYGDAPRSGASLGNTPPIVTSLPSTAQFGEQVLLYSTTPFAGYQLHQWTGAGWTALSDSRGVGVWQSWVPTLTQGANSLTFNINYAKYVVVGKFVTAHYNLSITGGTGASGGVISVGFGSGSTALPAAASANGIHGSFRWFDSGVSNWCGTIVGNTTTSTFHAQDGNGNQVGTSGTLSSGDQFQGFFNYESV